MNVGVIGLGLIGGSMAKALSTYTGHTVFGYDTDAAVLEKALADGAISSALDEAQCTLCDVILIALYPGAAIRAAQAWADAIRKGRACCGLLRHQKRRVRGARAARAGKGVLLYWRAPHGWAGKIRI